MHGILLLLFVHIGSLLIIIELNIQMNVRLLQLILHEKKRIKKIILIYSYHEEIYINLHMNCQLSNFFIKYDFLNYYFNVYFINFVVIMFKDEIIFTAIFFK